VNTLSPIEVVWVVQCTIGLVFGLFMSHTAVSRLVRRLRSKINGPVRLLAWERAVLCVVVTISQAVGLTLGIALALSPPTGVPTSTQIQVTALELTKLIGVPTLLLMTGILSTLPAWFVVVNWRLDAYDTAPKDENEELEAIERALVAQNKDSETKDKET
jgi:hypothetical protein